MSLWKRLLSRLHQEESGQAAVEYAILTSYLLVAGLVGSAFVMKFSPEMLNALQIYVDGFYLCLALPIP